MKRKLWYILTPAGKAGPYFIRSAAEDAAKPFGWKIIGEWREVANGKAGIR